jgi:hypothetical protein
MAKEGLQRKTFSASRLDEYASIDGLTKLTGQPVENWLLVIAKECIDNAADNAENAGVAPVISVTIGSDGIAVEDNGSGIPVATVKALTNYSVRTSSNAAYVSPTRGQQGNALQSILPMGFALDGNAGETVIESHGRAHAVRFSVDAVRRTPVVSIETSASEVKIGTRVTARWPMSAHSMIKESNFCALAEAYAFLNPHLRLAIGDDRWEATEPAWSKWRPNQPPSPHWYNVERLRQHMAAEIAHAEDHKKPCSSVRDFISQFRGLSGTTKVNEIGARIGLAERETLRDFFERDNIPALLVAMQNASRQVKPRDLGVIGQAHLTERLQDDGCDLHSIVYRKAEMELDGLPYVIEVAFGYRGDLYSATIIEGFNFTPAVGGSPFRLEGRLAGAEVDNEDPVTVVAHVACPRFVFTDKGKTRVALPPEVNIKLSEMVTSTTKAWTKQKRAEIRDHNALLRRRDRMTKPDKPMKQTEAFEQIAAQAYASAAGTVGLATQRQVFYAARRLMLALLGSVKLNSKYICQTLLVDYMAEHPEETESWDVIADDRGHFREPHTGRVVGLGTLAVRNEIERFSTMSIRGIDIKLPSVHTSGPSGRYSGVLFIEKEGFQAIVEKARIAERFDLALASTKGMSVTACRSLIEELCGRQGLPLYVLHDFDASGFSILKTLTHSNRRYSFQVEIAPIDLGLRLADIEQFERDGTPLDSEPVVFDASKEAVIERLRINGATDAEIAFLTTEPDDDDDDDDAPFYDEGDRRKKKKFIGRRVELNAMNSDQFVEFVERKLQAHKAGKVIPEADILREAFRAFKRGAQARAVLEAEVENLNNATFEPPADLAKRVRAYLDKNPTSPWDAAVSAIVEGSGKKTPRR